jgi:hypothetical protein
MHRRPDLQMSLPLPYEGWSENALREAHRAAHIRIPFDEAMSDQALAICLRCFAEARGRRSLAHGFRSRRNSRLDGG